MIALNLRMLQNIQLGISCLRSASQAPMSQVPSGTVNPFPSSLSFPLLLEVWTPSMPISVLNNQAECPSSLLSIQNIINLQRMIRNQKVERMLIENNIEQNNYSLTLKLKKIIEDLQARIEEQDAVILSFKRNIKNNKINQMEIEIQHLNDENHRLILLREDTQHRNKSNKVISSKKLNQGNHKKQNQGVTVTEFKVESKMSQVLKENQNLRRELLSLKISESFVKKRTSTINDRNSLVIEKKFVDYQKLQQNKMDLQAERSILTSKISKLQTKVTTLTSRNEQLQKLHYMQLHLSNPAE